jgi:hypothetical protein
MSTSTMEKNTVENAFSGPQLDQELDVYQAVSRTAVGSFVISIFGIAAFSFVPLLLLPVVGLAFAIMALMTFKRFPNEYLGRPFALLGGAISTLVLIAAPTWHTYVYMTEVPEGYTRVNFADFMTPTGRPDAPTQIAMQQNGKQIFIKGYIHPTSMDSLQAKRFVLVPDLGTCCFGGQPPLTHMIEVTLTGDQYATKSLRKQRLAGTLKVHEGLKPIEGLTGVFYQLKADVLK